MGRQSRENIVLMTLITTMVYLMVLTHAWPMREYAKTSEAVHNKLMKKIRVVGQALLQCLSKYQLHTNAPLVIDNNLTARALTSTVTSALRATYKKLKGDLIKCRLSEKVIK